MGRQGAAHRLVAALGVEVPSTWSRHSIFTLCFFSLICESPSEGSLANSPAEVCDAQPLPAGS